jgi:hypothetical protein
MRSRPLTLAAHGAVETGLGLCMLVAPFLFGFSVAAAVLAVVFGALSVGLGLSAVDERGTRVAAHEGYDAGISFAYLVAGLAVGLTGDPAGAVWLALAGLAQIGLNLTTRYSVAA